MKCPNCSFVNTDDIKTCRVCGFDLTPVETPKLEETTHTIEPSKPLSKTDSKAIVDTPIVPIMSDAKISKRRMIDDSEDEVLDTAFKSIFGVDKDAEEDPLDVATVERFLQKKKSIQPVIMETLTEVEDVEEDISSFEVEDTIEPISKKKVILTVMLIGILILLLAFKMFLPGLPWKYESNNESTETTEDVSIEFENTTETVLNLGDDVSIAPVNAFFNLLPEFINRGNLSILSLFENSQEALEVLTSFAVIGNLEKIADITISESEVTEDSAFYQVSTITNRLINGQQTQTASIWDFRAIQKDDIWILESFAVETGEYVASETTESNTQETEQTTEKFTEATTEKKTEPTKETTTEAAETTSASTSGILLNGFKSSGSFSGGEKSSGQDVAFARYGYHDTYERLAFDLYEWIGGKPNTPVEAITNYTASISDDGRTISIILTGAIEAYASQSSLGLANSPNIESVYYNYFGNGEAVAITINLKQSSQFKVFNLVSPAKLVVDIARFE